MAAGIPHKSETKAKAIGLLKEGNLKLGEIVKKTGVKYSTLHLWKQELGLTKRKGPHMGTTKKKKKPTYQAIEVPQTKPAGKVAVLISDDPEAILNILKGL